MRVAEVANEAGVVKRGHKGAEVIAARPTSGHVVTILLSGNGAAFRVGQPLQPYDALSGSISGVEVATKGAAACVAHLRPCGYRSLMVVPTATRLPLSLPHHDALRQAKPVHEATFPVPAPSLGEDRRGREKDRGDV